MISRDEIQEKVDIVKRKIEKNKTIPYYFLASIFVLGALFFFSSNLLFNKELNLITTEINQEMYLNNISFSIKDRKYNPNNGLVQFTIKLKENSSNSDLDLDFNIREKNNPTEIIPCEVVQITYSDYIVTTEISGTWEALSLTIKEKSEVSDNKYVKFYSDIRDIKIDDTLKKKSRNEYTKEVIDNEINDIKSKIEELNLDISDKKSEIEDINKKINLLEEDKKYQTESEIEVTENTISSNKTSIGNLENGIRKNENSIKELEEKINKLEEKKQDYR